MPTLTRISGPSVQTEALPNARFTARADTNVGAPIARGLGQFADISQKIGEQMQAKVDDTQNLAAQRAVSDNEFNWFDPNNKDGVYSHTGLDAMHLPDKAMPSHDQVVSAAAQGIRNPQARERFQQWAEGRREGFRNRLATYTTQEHEKYANAEFESGMARSKDEAINAYTEGRFADAELRRAEGLQTLRAFARDKGAPPDATVMAEKAYNSEFHYGVIQHLKSQGHDADAQAYLDKNYQDMSREQRDHASEALLPYMKDHQAELDAEASNQGGAPAPDDLHVGPPVKVKQNGTPTPEIRQILDDAAREVGVPRSMLYALAEQESSFNPKAVNPEALDDGDHASGLFNYRKTSAVTAHLQDRMDARQSAFAAAKEIRRRMDKGGAAYAIGAHIGGDGYLKTNSKVRNYIATVSARRERWRKELGEDPSGAVAWTPSAAGSGGNSHGRARGVLPTEPRVVADSGTMTVASVPDAAATVTTTAPEGAGAVTQDAQTQTVRVGPRTEADKLEWIQQHVPTDDGRRDRAMAVVQKQHMVQAVREKETDDATQERMWHALEQSDPKMSVRQALGDDYDYAEGKGFVAKLEARQLERAVGVPEVSNPHFKNTLDRLKYAATGGQGPDAEKRALKYFREEFYPYDPSSKLSEKDRKDFGDFALVVKTGNKAGLAKAATDGEIGQIIASHRLYNLKITDQQIKDDPAMGEKAAAFTSTMHTMIQNYMEANRGIAPGYKEVTKMADDLVMAAASVPAIAPASEYGWLNRPLFGDGSPIVKSIAPRDLTSTAQIPANHLATVKERMKAALAEATNRPTKTPQEVIDRKQDIANLQPIAPNIMSFYINAIKTKDAGFQ